jgi:predicted nuclease with RNAse H fold
MFLGIDPTSSEKRPTACALLDASGALARLAAVKTDADILALVSEWRPAIVAIDSPLGFPKGMCCLEESCACQSVWPLKGRACEPELARRGIPLYFTTKRSIIKQMVYRAIALAREMRSQGCQVIEVYPYASKVMLFGKPIPPKTKKEGLDFLRQRLDTLIPGLASHGGRLSHDLCDALVAAYTAYLHSLGQTEAVGLPEEERIVLPRAQLI